MLPVSRVLSPWDESVVLELALDDRAAIDRKVAVAVEAARAWGRTTIEERVALIGRFVEVAMAGREELAESITRQMGKPLSEARGEVGTMCARARMMASIAPGALADENVPLGDGIVRTIVRDPLGAVVDVAAWNYPLLIAVNVVVPAVLAGNTVLLKHASQTAGVGPWFQKAFAGAGAPAGLVTSVNVPGREAAYLLQHPAVAGVYFTGSVPVGRQVYRTVAEREQGFLDVGLELGGKDPAYVRADMPLEIVVPNLVGGSFYNCGQSCCAVERIYVERSKYADFVEAFVAEAAKWKVGDPMADGTLLGPLATPETIATLDAQIADARARGGQVLLGGARIDAPGWRYPATVVADATNEMELMREESFGPVIGIMPVDGDDAAVEAMNDTVFGLTASIWTADLQAGRQLARRTRAGTVFMNRCDFVDPALPWTGLGDSGKGITLSRLGFEYLTRARGLHLRPITML